MSERGFTLIEVLIALFISAIVAIMAYRGLDSAVQQRQSLQAAAERSNQILQFWTLLERDLTQITPRPIKDAYEQRQPALRGGLVLDDFLAFTRAGWNNPAGQQRSNMQRVSYAFQDDTIVRAMWRDVDATAQSEPQSLVVLRDVEDISVMFLNAAPNARDDGLGGEWLVEWGLQGSENDMMAIPQAIEVVVNTNDFGEVRRIFELATIREVPQDVP